jgi:hypothetical protein
MSALSITKRSLSINLLEAHTAITDPHHQVAVAALLVVVLLVDSAVCSAAVLVFGATTSTYDDATWNGCPTWDDLPRPCYDGHANGPTWNGSSTWYDDTSPWL